MAKNKKIDKKIFSKEEVQAALEVLHSEYFLQVISLLSYIPENKDLSYVKVPVSTPDGGLYLISILHVEGPRINLEKLSESAKIQEDSETVKEK